MIILEGGNIRRHLLRPRELVFLLPERLAPKARVIVGVHPEFHAFHAAKIIADFFTRNGITSIRIEGGPRRVDALGLQPALIRAIERQRSLPLPPQNHGRSRPQKIVQQQ